MKIQEKNKAIELRKLGYSFNEILTQVHVSKGTISRWCSELYLKPEHLDLLKSRIRDARDMGRLNAAVTNRNKRLNREKIIANEAKIEFDMYKNEILFFVGLTLYWAEGAKKTSRFYFVNSDYRMVQLMLVWINKYLKIKKEQLIYRLFVHQPYIDEDCESFWAEKIAVNKASFQRTCIKRTDHDFKKNPNYKGCFTITARKRAPLLKTKEWINLLCEYYANI